MFLAGNLYLNGAKPSKDEPNPLALPRMDPGIQLVEKQGDWYLQVDPDEVWAVRERGIVTTDMLGRAKAPNLPYLDHDGTDLRLESDYFGDERITENASLRN